MALDSLFVVIGLTVLLTGARLVVRSALLIATSFGMSRVLVGSTIVAFGTSAPELVISMTASLGDSDGLGVGNVIGSTHRKIGWAFLILACYCLDQLT